MKKKKIWTVILLILLTLTIAIAVFSIIRNNENSEETESQTGEVDDTSEETIVPEEFSDILIIGDSIGVGIGDEENLGIGERYLDLLDEENDFEGTLTNIAVSGHKSSQLVKLLQSGEHTSSISTADLIIMSIGGNDLNGMAFQRNLDLPFEFAQTLNTYTANLQTIISEIRSVNSEAQIALIGLYNPYDAIVPGLTSYLLEWNSETLEVADSDEQFSYIPTYNLFESHLDDYLYTDYFHPNGTGYQVIAEQLYTIMN